MLVELSRREPGAESLGGRRRALAGGEWRRALGWVIAELLTIKLIFLISMKIAFFSAPGHPLTSRDVEARLFPAGGSPVAAEIKEKSHD